MCSPTLAFADLHSYLDAALVRRVEALTTKIVAAVPQSAEVTSRMQSMLAGGKRLRPTLFFYGLHVVNDELSTDSPWTDAEQDISAALELFHVAALIHDDVMDRSPVRRGMPAFHVSMTDHFTDSQWDGDASQFGVSAAILAGDLALTWSETLFASALTKAPTSAENIAACRAQFDAMRSELMMGQYLDMRTGACGLERASVDASLEMIRLKSADYTAKHPVLLGAHLAGVDERVLDRLSVFGTSCGMAFQLRDDVLGVFGDAGATGKTASGDITEGKLTVMVAYAYQHTTAAGRTTLRDILGNTSATDTDIQAVREVLECSGALAAVETMISRHHDDAMKALHDADIAVPSREALASLLDKATNRSS